jgi:hypothetical protein
MARFLTVDGERCQVVASLGYNSDVGLRVTVVLHNGVERKVVGSKGYYRFWGPRDRAAPLIEHAAREAAVGRKWP